MQAGHQDNLDQGIGTESLSLYHYSVCPYCVRVRRYLNHLGLDIEQRDILRNPAYRDELRLHGGRTTVPCLRIEHDGGRVEWMYESMDIIAFLRLHFDH